MINTYKLSFEGNTISTSSNEAPLSFDYITYPKKRYEYTIYDAGANNVVSAGTVSMPFSAFDEVGIAAGYNGFTDFTWSWFSKKSFTNTTGRSFLQYVVSTTTNYYTFVCGFVHNNSNKSFTVDKNGQPLNTTYGEIHTPVSTTAKFVSTQNNNSIICVNKIIGVKYQ